MNRGASVTLLIVALAGAGTACDESEKPAPKANNGGRGGSSAADSGAGSAAGSGGTAVGGGGNGGSGGVSGVGGTAGAAGASGSGGAAGPLPSAGCGKANPATGQRQLAVGGKTGLYLVSIPLSYDVNHPYTLGFAFHGRDRNHSNCQTGDCSGFQTEFRTGAVLVYMQSLRVPTNSLMGGWESAQEREENVQFFQQVLAIIKAEYCVDERRIFVAGTSSGANFSNLLACRFGDQLLATAPVGGSLPETTNCRGKPAAVVIHGVDDPHVTFASGEAAREFYVQRNGCSNATTPDRATMHASIRQSRDAMQETHACVDYQGCASPSPVRWCEHSYGGYDNSTHGWPPNGGKLIRDFVQALP